MKKKEFITNYKDIGESTLDIELVCAFWLQFPDQFKLYKWDDKFSFVFLTPIKRKTKLNTVIGNDQAKTLIKKLELIEIYSIFKSGSVFMSKSSAKKEYEYIIKKTTLKEEEKIKELDELQGFIRSVKRDFRNIL